MSLLAAEVLTDAVVGRQSSQQHPQLQMAMQLPLQLPARSLLQLRSPRRHLQPPQQVQSDLLADTCFCP